MKNGSSGGSVEVPNYRFLGAKGFFQLGLTPSYPYRWPLCVVIDGAEAAPEPQSPFIPVHDTQGLLFPCQLAAGQDKALLGHGPWTFQPRRCRSSHSAN